MRRALCLLVLASAAIAAAPADVSAQTPQVTPGRRQYQGLFGGGKQMGASTSGHRLNLTGNIGHGYDDDLRIDVVGSPIIGQPPPGQPQGPVLRSGSFTMASASMAYGYDADNVQVSVGAGGLARYYRDDADPFVGTGDVRGSLSIKLSERTSFFTNHNMGVYQQNLTMVGGIAGGDPFAGAPTTFIDAGTYASAGSDFSLSHRVTSRVSVNGGYGLYWNNVQFVPASAGYGGQNAHAGFTVGVLKNLRVGATYRYTKTESDQLNAYNGHSVEFVADFGQALSLSRNSTIGFGAGMTGVNDIQGNTKYYATGHVNYSYDIGRSWGFQAGYFRSVDFYQTLAQPVFLDTGQVSFGGSIGRRVSLNTDVGIVTGLIGLATPQPRYFAGSGSVGVQVGMTKNLAIGATYSFYSYRIDEGAIIPMGMLSRFDRQSVALTLDMWVPIISGSRRLNASR